MGFLRRESAMSAAPITASCMPPANPSQTSYIRDTHCIGQSSMSDNLDKVCTIEISHNAFPPLNIGIFPIKFSQHLKSLWSKNAPTPTCSTEAMCFQLLIG